MLVPTWLLNTCNPALAHLGKRPVTVTIDELGVSLTGQVQQLSMTHARVLPDRCFYLCRSVHVEINFRYENVVYTLSGQAQPGCSDPSFCFEFDSVARKLMMDLGARMPGMIDGKSRTAPSAVSPCAEAEHESKDTRRTPSRETARRTQHLPPPGGVERRASHRYDLDTQAHVSLLRDGKSVECVMVDMSKTGCRLYFETPTKLEPGIQVEVQFTENGFPLRLAATVQTTASEHQAGLRFVRNSERMSERLDNLLFELAESNARHR